MKVPVQHTICIQGGHVFDPAQQLDGIMDVFIENDTIVALGNKPEGFEAGETIDANGKMVFPGFVDLSAFLAEPGFAHKGSIATETRAAARSGFTSVCCTPNTKPVVDSAAVAALILDKAKQASFTQVFPIGALTAGLAGEQLSNMAGLRDAGCVALSNQDAPFKDARVIKQCYSYASGFDIPVMITPLELSLADGCMHEGATSTKLGLAGISENAECIALAQHLLLAEETGVRLHVSRITSKRALNMIVEAKTKGLNISADVALANLVYTDEHCLGYDSLMHVSPVYRSEQDRQALLAGVNDGHLAICSNHKPHELAAKMAPFAASEAGISTMDSFAHVLFTLVNNGALNLSSAIQAVSTLPGQLINAQHGQLKVEGRADLCIVNLNRKTTLSAEDLASKGHNNPWLGIELTGQVECTINGGHLVYKI